MRVRGREDGAGYYDEVSLEELQFMWKSVTVRRTIRMSEDRPYGQLSPRILLRAYYACLLILAFSLARYFTEIYFSRIIILGVVGKKVIFKD